MAGELTIAELGRIGDRVSELWRAALPVFGHDVVENISRLDRFFQRLEPTTKARRETIKVMLTASYSAYLGRPVLCPKYFEWGQCFRSVRTNVFGRNLPKLMASIGWYVVDTSVTPEQEEFIERHLTGLWAQIERNTRYMYRRKQVRSLEPCSLAFELEEDAVAFTVRRGK